MPERDAARARAQLQGSQPRLLDAPTPSTRPSAASSARSRPASPAARSASTSRASSATCWCATSMARSASIYESNLFPSICGRVCPQETQCESQCVINKKMESGGDRPARALRRRQRAAAQGGAAAIRSSRWAGSRSSAPGPAGLAAAADLRPLRRRGDRLRGAARGRRRAALRHPVVPPAARHHRSRGAAAEGHGRPLRDQQGGRQDLHHRRS